MIRVKISPSLLDSFRYYQMSDSTWDKYWGGSDEPKKSCEEFQEEKRKELIASINGDPLPPNEAMQRGSAFDGLIGNMIKGLVLPQSDFDYSVTHGGSEFIFNNVLTNQVFNMLEWSKTQVWVEKIYSLPGGNEAHIRGKIDNLFLDHVIDLKTTKTYKAFNYKDGMQHRFYLDALREYDLLINNFTYLVTDFKKVYEEFYTWNDDYPGEIQELCNHLIGFIEENRDFIHNDKRFY